MEYEQKVKTLNRIFSGSFYSATNLNYLPFVYFKHPTLQTKTTSEYIYDSSFDKATNRGVMTKDEAIKVAVKTGAWSNIEECNIANFKQFIDRYAKDMEVNKYNSGKLDILKKKHSDLRIKLAQLEQKRSHLIQNTAESYAEVRKSEYIIRSISYQPETNVKVFDLEWIYNYNVSYLINILAHLYFTKDVIETKTIRELARTTPWRLYYAPAKTIHSNLFVQHPQDYSDEQLSLLYWSSVYDYVYESTERPDDHIIESDEQLDKWFEAQDKKNKKKPNKAEKNVSMYRDGPGMTEIFYPCSPDKAQEIEDMNSPMIKAAKAKMFQRLAEKGELNEFQHGAVFIGVS